MDGNIKLGWLSAAEFITANYYKEIVTYNGEYQPPTTQPWHDYMSTMSPATMVESGDVQGLDATWSSKTWDSPWLVSKKENRKTRLPPEDWDPLRTDR